MTDNISKENTLAMKHGYQEVNGIRMYYEIYGTGKPLVLIHGGGSTIQTTFANIIPTLAKKHLIIAVELQAHGRTSDRDTPLSFEQDADDVSTLLQKLNIGSADFMGFSNGGNTVMQIALRNPRVVDRMIICSAFYKRDGMFPGFWDFMKKGTFADMPASLKQAFLAVTPDSSKLQNMYNKCAQRVLNFEDWSDEQLKSIKAKTLIINGDKDVATTEHVTTMHRLISNSQLLIIPGGHGEYMGEISFDPKVDNIYAFTTLIEKFLTE
ncbi:alpha/beta hydrolase [Pseudochryseolinea flava]|uniref:Alpha/beta hydrolase n=2 Tax=Pseudochryseolinea flava TaxID=2059302 RepID=A0A364Y3N5_9BACT|nr:alpha/beta hydrolase [Pseudochryseolinea flava]